jgi:hypothetical protein
MRIELIPQRRAAVSHSAGSSAFSLRPNPESCLLSTCRVSKEIQGLEAAQLSISLTSGYWPCMANGGQRLQ